MPESHFASILRAELGEMAAYQPAQGSYDVRLDANESPPLLCSEARAALSRALAPETFNRYPDPRATELRQAIADRVGASPDEILAGVGTDEVIALLLSALDRPRPGSDAPAMLTISPTFVMYRHSARTRGYRVVEVPLDAAWDLDVNAMRRAIAFARPNLIFLASPNNPTGALLSRDRVEAVIAAAEDALVIVDEAYVDFARGSQLDLRAAYPNVAVLRTLSKIGLAALRVGWMIGPADLVREVDKLRQPYNLPEPSQRGAVFALRELGAELAAARDRVVAERARLAAGLSALGCGVAASDANFLWVETRRPAVEVYGALAARGVLVRSFHTTGGRLAHRIRITVGLPEENDRLLSEMALCV